MGNDWGDQKPEEAIKKLEAIPDLESIFTDPLPTDFSFVGRFSETAASAGGN